MYSKLSRELNNFHKSNNWPFLQIV